MPGSGEGKRMIQDGLHRLGWKDKHSPNLHDLNNKAFLLFILCGRCRPACLSFPWDQAKRTAVLCARGKWSWRDARWGSGLEARGLGGEKLVGLDGESPSCHGKDSALQLRDLPQTWPRLGSWIWTSSCRIKTVTCSWQARGPGKLQGCHCPDHQLGPRCGLTWRIRDTEEKPLRRDNCNVHFAIFKRSPSQYN